MRRQWSFLTLLVLAIAALSCSPSTPTAGPLPTRINAEVTASSTAQAAPTQTIMPSLAPPTGLPPTTPSLPIVQQVTVQPWLHHIIGGLQNQESFKPDLRPTGIAAAPDGSLFVSTAGHSYVFHIDAYGKLIKYWGGYEATPQGQKPKPGIFNEPWGIALSTDGFIFVTDLWNSRIQKFTQDGAYVTEWGEFGQGNEPFKLFGPRGIAIDSKGRLLVTDTGNKRILVYDANGKYISQVGKEGIKPGEFNEPVGIAMDPQGTIYVADYWNSRIQVLQIDDAGVITPKSDWYVSGWGDRAQEFKPYVCLQKGNIFTTVPMNNRVLEFSPKGDLLQTFDINQTGFLKDGIPGGIACDANGGIWVSDIKNNLWLYLTP